MGPLCFFWMFWLYLLLSKDDDDAEMCWKYCKLWKSCHNLWRLQVFYPCPCDHLDEHWTQWLQNMFSGWCRWWRYFSITKGRKQLMISAQQLNVLILEVTSGSSSSSGKVNRCLHFHPASHLLVHCCSPSLCYLGSETWDYPDDHHRWATSPSPARRD